MGIFLWVVGAALVAALLLFTAYASTVGSVGIVSNRRFVRCPRCGHHGLAGTAPFHDQGCPEYLGVRVAHVVHGNIRLHH